MKIVIPVLQPKRLWRLLIALFATLLFFFLYDFLWMVFCCLFAYLIQLICLSSCYDIEEGQCYHSFDTSRLDYEAELDNHIKMAKQYKITFCLIYVIIVFLDLFPFFAWNDFLLAYVWNDAHLFIQPYEGGLIVTLLTIFIIIVWTAYMIMILNYDIKSAFSEKLKSEMGREQIRKELMAKQETLLNQIKSKYGDNATIIEMAYNKIIVSEQKKCVVIYNEEYLFTDIIGCSLIDDATSETITTSTGEAKTSTGSMLGRAVVGGVLTGGLGAVAGAATARKNIATNATSQTITTHKYVIYINVNSLKNPTITIPIGEDTQKAHELANLFNVIIAKGQG